MASVSELCAVLAHGLREDPARITKYARYLTNAGRLPKSTGKVIAQVDSMECFDLMVALAVTDQPSRAVEKMSFVVDYVLSTGLSPLRPRKLLQNVGARAIEQAANLERNIWSAHPHSGLRISRNRVSATWYGVGIEAYPLPAQPGSVPKYDFLPEAWFAEDEDTKRAKLAFSRLKVEATIPFDVFLRVGAMLAGVPYNEALRRTGRDVKTSSLDTPTAEIEFEPTVRFSSTPAKKEKSDG